MKVATLPSCIRSYQTPVTPVRRLGGEEGGDTFQLIVTLQQRLCLIPFGPFFTVDAACRTNLSMSVKAVETQSIYSYGARGCALIPFGPFFSVDAGCGTNLSMSMKEVEIQSHL